MRILAIRADNRGDETCELFHLEASKADMLVDYEFTTEGAMEMVRAYEFDAIFSHTHLPDRTGVDLLRKIRQHKIHVPFVLQFNGDDPSHQLERAAYAAGAWGVMPAASSNDIVIINLETVVRHAKGQPADVLQVGKLKLTAEGVFWNENALPLSLKRKQLLKRLMLNKNRLQSREQLLSGVYGNVSVESRTIDVHIGRIRKVLEEIEEGAGRLIRSVHGEGYVLEEPDYSSYIPQRVDALESMSP